MKWIKGKTPFWYLQMFSDSGIRGWWRQLADDGAIRHRTFSPPLFTFELNSGHCLRFHMYATLQFTLFTLWNFHLLILIAVVATSQWSKGGMNPSGNANAVAFWLMASLVKIFYLTFCIFVNGQFPKLCFWVHTSSAYVDKEPVECVSRIIKKDDIYKQGLIFATKEGMKWQKRLQRFRTQLYLRAWVMCQPRIVQNCRPIELNSTRKSNRDTCFIVKYQSNRFNPVLISWNIEIKINISDWTRALWVIQKYCDIWNNFSSWWSCWT